MSVFTARRRRIITTTTSDLAENSVLISSGRPGDGSVDKEGGAYRTSKLNEVKRADPTVSKEQLETLYRIDGITFRIVQKYIEKMIGAGYIIKGGSAEAQELCETFCEKIDIRALSQAIIRDIFIAGAGTAWTEIGYNEEGTDIISVKVINPKSGIDFIKDEDGNILYDSTLRALGYKLGDTIGYPKILWTKDRIEVQGDVVWTPKSDKDDGRDRIASWTLISNGEDELGMSPLEPGYKASLIRLNLEDTVGNSAFRSLALAAYVGSEEEDPRTVTDEQLNSVRDRLREIDQDTVWAFRRNVEVKEFPVPEIKNYEALMYYFADLASSGAGVGLSLILQPTDRGYRGDVETRQQEFMESITLFQESLATQIRDILFKRYLKAKGKSADSAPYITFRGKEAGIALSTARRLSTYARYGILTPTLDLENWIREREGLEPITEAERKKATKPTQPNPFESKTAGKEIPTDKKVLDKEVKKEEEEPEENSHGRS